MSALVSSLTTILKIGLVTAVCGVLFIVGGYLGVQWALSAEEFEVPDVQGMELDEATELLAAQGLIVEVDSQSLTDNVIPEGAILRQNPLAGTAIKRQRGIRLTLSAGAPRRELPMVVGNALQRAQIALQQKNLEVEYVARVFSSEFARDQVIGQQPSSTELPEGTSVPVRLLVSNGPPARKYVMPDLAYRDADVIAPQLERLGFNVQRLPSASGAPGRPPSTIISTDPSQGFPVEQGDVIRLYLNR
jgi:serine/threonine-protein kinase